ncbi:MAG: hypothetical protein NTZ09_04100 [Candidatus Hydrogenedentes bacterium]|nr:hypothetical protein [Candidatus Hydrogenedentota bacterium]
MKLAKAVSCCFNQNGINNQMVGMTHAALNGADIIGGSGTDYEAWRSDDGSWNIRCTTKQTPRLLADPGNLEPEELKTNRYILPSVTYRIPAQSIQQGNPQIEVADSRVFFNF